MGATLRHEWGSQIAASPCVLGGDDGSIYALRIPYSHDELLGFFDQVSAVLPDKGTVPPLIDIDGTPYVLVTIGVDQHRHQIKIGTGGPFKGSQGDQRNQVPTIPVTVPRDAFYVEDSPGASWGSWGSWQRPS